MVSRLSETSVVPRLLRLAPGNLFIAFAAAGCLEGGMPSLAGSLGAFVTMAVVKREWAALAVGFSAAALTALIRGLLTPL
jgi:anti-sigma factor RsiW